MSQRNGYRNQGRGKRNWRDRTDNSVNEGDSFREREPREDSKESIVDTSSSNVSMNDTKTENEATPTAKKEKKFGNRARLYVGNLPRNLSENEMKALFEPYGEASQFFIEKEKNFGFVRMAFRDQAEKAIAALNGTEVKGRELRVRFAASSCSVKVTNLHPTVSNELLEDAFNNMFGEVEHAVVVTDERGKSLGHGIVDFAKKFHAVNAIERCRNGCFILTKSPMPVAVQELVRENDDDGLPEKQIQRSAKYNAEREVRPRMAQHGTPEFDMAVRWKTLYENEKARREELEAHLRENRRQLEHEMEQFHHHEEANYLRLQLAEHQREQQRLQECLRQHERYMEGGSGHPPGGPPPAVPSLMPPTQAVPTHGGPSHTGPSLGPPIPNVHPPPPPHSMAGEHPIDRGSESLLPPPIQIGGPPGPPRMGLPPQNPAGFLLPGPPISMHPNQFPPHH